MSTIPLMRIRRFDACNPCTSELGCSTGASAPTNGAPQARLSRHERRVIQRWDLLLSVAVFIVAFPGALAGTRAISGLGTATSASKIVHMYGSLGKHWYLYHRWLFR